jgi:hypothetical protein
VRGEGHFDVAEGTLRRQGGGDGVHGMRQPEQIRSASSSPSRIAERVNGGAANSGAWSVAVR